VADRLTLLLVQQHFQFDQELVHHPQDVVETERLELHDRVQAVAELRREAATDHFHRIGAVVLLGEADAAPRGLGGTGIGGHHQDHVAEVRLAAVGVGQHAAVHHLQQDVEHVRVRLLDLVEQQHAVRVLTIFSVSRPPWSKPT
jgi:hypothetical protein